MSQKDIPILLESVEKWENFFLGQPVDIYCIKYLSIVPLTLIDSDVRMIIHLKECVI